MTAEEPTDAGSDLDAVHQALSDAAIDRALAVRDSPELTRTTFRGGEASASARIEPSELPSRTRAMRAGRYALILGALPEQASAATVKEALRRFRNQCVIARSYLSANEALDLQLILVGPRGSERTDDWRALALAIERDDRVARKLVWLRPSDPAADAASFAEFLKRTFLARPWTKQAVYTMAALDNLNRAAALADSAVPRSTVDEWVKLALNPEVEGPDELVNQLVAAWSRRGAP